MSLVMRNQWAAYMNCINAASPAYYQMGEGFTDLSESKNPSEYSRKYIHESSERADVVGYAPSLSYSVDYYTGDKVAAEIRIVTDQEKLGSDAQRDIVLVDLFDSVGANTYKAYRRTFSIVPDGKGSGTDALIYTGNLKAGGDATIGTFNTATKTFNADAVAALAVTSVAGETSGTTAISVVPTLTGGNGYVYKTGETSITLPGLNDLLDYSWIEWDGEADIEAESGDYIAIVEKTSAGLAQKAGQATVTAHV